MRVELAEAVHVQTLCALNREDASDWKRMQYSEIRVGNSTSAGDSNPRCKPDVKDGGCYECDLWGKYVSIRRWRRWREYFNFPEIGVWTQRNIATLGTASQQTTLAGSEASKA